MAVDREVAERNDAHQPLVVITTGKRRTCFSLMSFAALSTVSSS